MTTMIPTKCDLCGAEAEELTQAPHMSGVMDGGAYRCAWLCGACDDVHGVASAHCFCDRHRPADDAHGVVAFVPIDGNCACDVDGCSAPARHEVSVTAEFYDEPHVHAIEHSRAWTNGDVLGRCACGVECLNGVWKEED